MSSVEERPPVVIDNGSGNIRIGFAGEEGPQAQFASLWGQVKDGKEPPVGSQLHYVGDDAQEHRALLDLEYPIERGVVEDWEAMDQIYDYAFNSRLKVDPKLQKVMFSERPLTDKKNREKLAELMFESYELHSMYVASSAIMSLYAADRSTGIIVDVGDGVTTIVPVYEGFTPPKSGQRREFAGRDLTEALQEGLLDQGIPIDVATAAEFKEKFCFLAMDEEDRSSCRPKTLEVAGRDVTLAAQRYEIPELLFSDKATAIHKALWSSIIKCNRDMRRDLYQNIVLVGGSTQFSNFPERLEHEFRTNTKCPKGIKLNFDQNPKRHLATWFGGSILADLGEFQTNWVSKAEFEERGSTVIHRIQRR